MLQMNIHDAKTQLSKLIERACRGEEVVIARAGKPVVRLTAIEARPRNREFGALRGKARVDDRFFEPLPETELKAWEQAVRLLLDTHTLLWWLDGDERLSQRSRSVIGNAATSVFISAASAQEITTKVRIGKLPGAVEVAERFSEIVDEQDFHGLPISVEHARVAGLMPGEHRDPFDRMLIAQAQIERLALVSNESLFDRFGIRRLW